jgi:serine protease Do/serine protease DegQ
VRVVGPAPRSDLLQEVVMRFGLPVALCSALTLIGFGSLSGAPAAQPSRAASAVAPAAIPLPLGEEGSTPSLAPLLREVTPAVVSVAVRGRRAAAQAPMLRDPRFRHFFPGPHAPREHEFQGGGSGVIVDAGDGIVLTNHHVVADASEIGVLLGNGRRLEAELVGSDPESDVAVLRVQAEGLDALPLGDSDALEVGDFVVAIGNPFGLRQTATLGIVSALGRNGLGIGGYEDFIQTDASINPGNSGGALVDMNGQLVGINSAILAPAGGNVGIGFAIPIGMASEVMRQILEYGGVKRGRLGVVIQDLTPTLAEAFGAEGQRGAVVSSVEPGSAAERAGLQPGDLIVGLDGEAIRGSADLRNRIGLHRAGDEIRLDVWRDGRVVAVAARIGGAEGAAAAAARSVPALAGVVLQEARDGASKGDSVEGLAVVGVESGSAGWDAGLRPGDVIVSANRIPVKTLEALGEAAGRDEDGILLRVVRGEGAFYAYVREA